MKITHDNKTRNLIFLNQSSYLKLFCDHLQESGSSPKTIHDYQNDLKVYFFWLNELGIHDAKEVGSLTVQKFRDHSLKNKKPATVNRSLTTLRKFYQWLGKPDLVSKVRVKMVEEIKPCPKSLTAKEWEKLDLAADRYSDRDHYLSLSVLRLMRYAGLRVGEVCLLNLEDLECNKRSGKIRIKRGKGLKAREIPLVKEVCDVLSLYLEHREKMALKWQRTILLKGIRPKQELDWPTGRVFLGQRGPFTPNGLYRLVEKIGTFAKIEVHPHMLRHTFAKSLVDPKRYGLTKDAAPLSAVKQLMGHSNIQTTSIYLLHSEEDLEKIMNGN